MSYVILSRVTSIEQLYLKEFDQKKIYCSSIAKREAERLRARAINKIATEWDHQRKGVARISSINARSLQLHFQDMQKDDFIMKSDIILVQETWFESDPKDPITQVHEYFIHGRSKGIALFTKTRPNQIESFQTAHCSIIKASYDKFDLINLYRFSSDTNILQFTADVLALLDTSKSQVVAGDINIDLLKTPQNHFTHSLEVRGFHQIVTKPTHELGGLIDHVYFYSPHKEVLCAMHKYHTVFWSDHTCQSFILNTSSKSEQKDNSNL